MPLAGKSINAILSSDPKFNWKLSFTITLKGIGHDTANELFIKIYFFDANRIGKHSSTYREFGQEITYPPDKFPTTILPANAAIPIKITLKSKFFDPEIKIYPMAMQVWFGKELPNEARFKVEVIKIIDT